MGFRENNCRPDLMEKVTGRAEFVSDLNIEGMAWGHVVRSAEPHARIIEVDYAVAISKTGVIAVLTGSDLDRLAQPEWGLFYEDRPVIARDRVRYVGEPVAVVIAETQAQAENAAEFVNITYEPLPNCGNAVEAVSAGAPLIHPNFAPIADFYFKGRARGVEGTNIFQEYFIEHGDVDSAEVGVDQIFEHSYSFPGISHFALEPHCAIAKLDETGLTVWSGAQSPTAVQKVLSRVFGMPLARVRVIVPYVGGGFGGKASVKIEPMVVAAAQKAGRPVKILFSLEESMLTCRRLGANIMLRTGVDANGKIVSRRGELLLDGGAYADTGPAVAVKAAHRLLGPYEAPNLKVCVRAVYTNTVPGAAFRSIGGPQAVWATESHMDEIAEELGQSPEVFRRRNMLPRGGTVIEGLRPLDADLEGMMDLVIEGLEVETTESNKARGLALAISDPGILPVAGAVVRLHVDGSISVSSASVEIGQGVRGVLRKVVAEALSQPLESVHILPSDTGQAPFDWGTGASRSSVMMGLAVSEAAASIVTQLNDMAREAYCIDPESFDLVPGGIELSSGFVSFRELFHQAYGIDSGDLFGHARISPVGKSGTLQQNPLFWETAAGACNLEVDEDTGEIRLNSYSSAADVGKRLSPAAAEGQETGASIQGLGHAILERLVFVDAQPINATPLNYHVPTTAAIPQHVRTAFIENEDGPGPGGAKGMGEAGILPVAPAIGNALAKQYGIRIRDLPMTPERVWLALNGKNNDET